MICWFGVMLAVVAPVSLDVRGQGAVGDGRTEDTAAIQRTIDACSAAAGASTTVGEVRGRTWDRLSEDGLPGKGKSAKALTADGIATLGGRQVPLCMIGDSITWAQEGDCWRKHLLRNVPELAFVGTHTARFGYSHAGEGGNSTPGVLARVDDPNRVPDCPYYHLMIGANDSSAAACAADVSRVASNTVANVWKIVDRLLARPTTRKVFLASILPLRVAKRPYRDVAGSKANELMRAEVGRRYPSDRVVWVEYEKPLRRDLDAWYGKGDLVHPHEKGYETIAALFAPQLAALVPSAASPVSDFRSCGVAVENFWDESASATRPLVPGWYVLSFAASREGSCKVRLRNRTDDPKGVYDKTFDLVLKAGVRGEFEFMTGYDGYGYRVSPFFLEATDAEGRPVPVSEVQVEKMRPSRKASRYGRGSFVDAVSPICAGEMILRSK